MDELFQARRGAALVLLTSATGLTRAAGSFLGQCIVDPTPLTPAQSEWLGKLLDRAGYPRLDAGGEA